MASLKSPRPTPKFFIDDQTLSTKKERLTPREQYPPKPPVKSAPPISRFFQNRLQLQRAQAVSFRESESSILSKHYDESCNELYFDQCFHVECKIGAGSFGEVFKVKSKENGKYYAVKRSVEKFKGDNDRIRKFQEVAKHEQLPKHPNCIQFVKAWEERGHLYIQTELCDTSLGNYSDQIHDIPEKLIWNYLLDLLLAVKHLHDHNLIHMDIKPANIFISKNGICKLGDFGLVLDLSKGNLSDALEGDPKYLAPELMQSKFTKAADIFSLGITILELAGDLDLPRGGDSWHNLRRGIIPFHLLKHISIDLQKIIKVMMHPNYRKRPSVDKVLMNPVLKKVWRRRKCELMIGAVLSSLRQIFLKFISYLGNYFYYPLKKWWGQKSKIEATPPLPSPNIMNMSYQNPTDWDYNISDDDCFDISTVSLNSIPRYLDVSNDSDHDRKLVNSTPTASRLERDRLSPTLFSSADILNHSISPIGPDNRELSKSNIGPKNLMEIFESEATDED